MKKTCTACEARDTFIPEVRQRPPKTDFELMHDYLELRERFPYDCSFSFNGMCKDASDYDRMLAIGKELGPQKILEERVRRLEESNTLAHQKANWHLKFVKIQNVTLCVLIVLTLLNLFL